MPEFPQWDPPWVNDLALLFREHWRSFVSRDPWSKVETPVLFESPYVPTQMFALAEGFTGSVADLVEHSIRASLIAAEEHLVGAPYVSRAPRGIRIHYSPAREARGRKVPEKRSLHRDSDPMGSAIIGFLDRRKLLGDVLVQLPKKRQVVNPQHVVAEART